MSSSMRSTAEVEQELLEAPAPARSRRAAERRDTREEAAVKESTEAATTPAAEDAAEAKQSTRELQEAPYRRGTWNGQVKFECTNCAFDTLDERLIREHVRKAHNLRLPKES